VAELGARSERHLASDSTGRPRCCDPERRVALATLMGIWRTYSPAATQRGAPCVAAALLVPVTYRRYRRAASTTSPSTADTPSASRWINTTIKAVLRRARGMRDEQMLLPKLK
jgi:hypothetical protein